MIYGKAQIVVGIFSCVLASGLVFGFAALKSVLIGENVYRELCTEEELDKRVPVCYKQDLKCVQIQPLVLVLIVSSPDIV